MIKLLRRRNGYNVTTLGAWDILGPFSIGGNQYANKTVSYIV